MELTSLFGETSSAVKEREEGGETGWGTWLTQIEEPSVFL